MKKLTDSNETNWLSAAEQQTWRVTINGILKLLTTLNQSSIDDAGLSFQEYRVLVLLSENKRISMSSLAEGAMVTRSTLSRQVSRLISQGLLEQVSDFTDARVRWVKLTKKGRKTLVAAAPDHVEQVRKYFTDLMTPEEAKVLSDVFSRVDSAIGGIVK